MDRREQRGLEKLLFCMLASTPDAFGLVLEDGGWISLKDLHRVLAEEPRLGWLRPPAISQFAAMYRPGSFEWDQSRLRVRPELRRADLTSYPSACPPVRLYAAIRPRAAGHVRAHGLRPGGARVWVVLAATQEMALRIGRRRDPAPLLITVAARRAWDQGVFFRKAGEGLYLVEDLSPEWLILPLPRSEPRVDRQTSKGARVRATQGAQGGGDLEQDRTATLQGIGGFAVRSTHMPAGVGPGGGEGKGRRGRKGRGEAAWKEARRRGRRR